MHDLIVRGGTVLDGSGGPGRTADVAVADGVVTEVGRVRDRARRELDADGALVIPGIVDIHSHYDAQVTWDPMLTPSSWHGVTTVVMGNCGVGFAPVAPDRHEWLIGLMEGVEDIPGSALADGIRWNWETFPEYLDAVDAAPKALDVAALVPHGPVRAYVMGERGAANEAATPEDIARIAAIVKEGVAAGAIGFSMNRTIFHKANDGRPVPGTFAGLDEVFAMAEALAELDSGIIELAAGGFMADPSEFEAELAWMEEVARRYGRPVSFGLLQDPMNPLAYRRTLAECARMASEGLAVRPQVPARSIGLLMGLGTTFIPVPFRVSPTYAVIADLPVAERAQRMRDPEMRRRILAETEAQADAALGAFPGLTFEVLFPLGDPPNYEPPRSDSIAGRAARLGRSGFDVLYDTVLERDGEGLLLFPIANYNDCTYDVAHELLVHPSTVLGLIDGGAHCGCIADAGVPTWMFTHWGRDRDHDRIPVETIVQMMTSDTAEVFGLGDRGRLEPGKRGDVAILDFDRLAVGVPTLVDDLPSGATRFVQRAEGWVATIVAGEVVVEDGEETDARPGRLVRGTR